MLIKDAFQHGAGVRKQFGQYPRGYSVPFVQQSKKHMLCACIILSHLPRLLHAHLQYSFAARRKIKVCSYVKISAAHKVFGQLGYPFGGDAVFPKRFSGGAVPRSNTV